MDLLHSYALAVALFGLACIVVAVARALAGR